jgi:hypothetical protein
MTTDSTRLRELATTWEAKAKAAHNLYVAMEQPTGPQQRARFSPYHGTYAVFAACADPATCLTEAASASEECWRSRECTGSWTLTDLKDFTAHITAYHRALDKAVNAVRRAMIIEDAVEAGKLAAAKSDAAIAEELEAVGSIRNVFCRKKSRTGLGVPR